MYIFSCLTCEKVVDPSVRIGERTCAFEMTWIRKTSDSRGRPKGKVKKLAPSSSEGVQSRAKLTIVSELAEDEILALLVKQEYS